MESGDCEIHFAIACGLDQALGDEPVDIGLGFEDDADLTRSGESILGYHRVENSRSLARDIGQ